MVALGIWGKVGVDGVFDGVGMGGDGKVLCWRFEIECIDGMKWL